MENMSEIGGFGKKSARNIRNIEKNKPWEMGDVLVIEMAEKTDKIMDCYDKTLEISDEKQRKEEMGKIWRMVKRDIVIKEENIYEAFESHLKRRIDRGENIQHSHIPGLKKVYAERKRKEQEESLSAWMKYFISQESNVYPIWFKSFALRGVLNTGAHKITQKTHNVSRIIGRDRKKRDYLDLDVFCETSEYKIDKKEFKKRTKYTAEPFLSLNKQALDSVYEHFNNQKQGNKNRRIGDFYLQTYISRNKFAQAYDRMIELKKMNRGETVKNIERLARIYDNQFSISKEDLLFLYKTGDKIYDFKGKKDIRAYEILKHRDKREDIAYIFDVPKDQVSFTKSEFVSGKSTYHFGNVIKLSDEDLKKLQKNGVTEFPTIIKGDIDFQNITTTEGLLPFPENMEILNLGNLPSAEGLPPLPKGLKELDLNYLRNLKGIKSFPKSLKKLKLNGIVETKGGFPLLPEGLEELYLGLPSLDFSQLQQFPNSLKKLDLRRVLHIEGPLSLPKSLKSLVLPRNMSLEIGSEIRKRYPNVEIIQV
ncbi:MAG: hypothetical protein OXU73_02955 [Candidatus Campbellbacteria bacterium]|nr:hypothetical protein [Candidatus Campbellbacteria bacterium]